MTETSLNFAWISILKSKAFKSKTPNTVRQIAVERKFHGEIQAIITKAGCKILSIAEVHVARSYYTCSLNGHDHSGLHVTIGYKAKSKKEMFDLIKHEAEEHINVMELIVPMDLNNPLVDPIYALMLIKHAGPEQALIVLQEAITERHAGRDIFEPFFHSNRTYKGSIEAVYTIRENVNQYGGISVKNRVITIPPIPQSTHASLIGRPFTDVLELPCPKLFQGIVIETVDARGAKQGEREHTHVTTNHLSVPFLDVVSAYMEANPIMPNNRS